MGDKVEYVTTYWVEGDTLVQRCDTLEGCDLIHERIVRCRDCRYMRHHHAEESKDRKDFWWCMLGDWKKGIPLYKDSGFCAWGERRDA